MWSCAAVDHVLQVFTCCVFRDALLMCVALSSSLKLGLN